ncbi:U-box domain-containing protein 9-like [Phoenix dactylifera]|uniref:RING-type E3 ubiquitin transferase n=1 Tax=Phoenix dactylifera TaxID=42345 RepID=A0A8B9B153_PHODC|nr:U-box domain-containing protein 9-like [Phoenix dactylifera]
MEKSGAAEAELSTAAESAAALAAEKKVGELKRELWRLVRLISDDDDGRIDSYDEAANSLAELKDLTFGSPAVPQHFLCPISCELMRDPVIVASGETYDRPFIQKLLNSGDRICPRSHEVLPNTILTPNHLLQSMISEWCKEHDIPQPRPWSQHEDLITRKEHYALYKLLDKISSSSLQKQAMKELRLLTKHNEAFRALLGEKPDTIPQLLSVLSAPGLNDDPEFHNNTVTAILNISIHDRNKKIVGDDPQAIPFLIDSLKDGTMETRSNAAAGLFCLSALDSNKLKIVELGAIKPLLELLEQGSKTAKWDAAQAIFNICLAPENKARAVKEGVVGVAWKAIMDQSLVDESLAILALFKREHEAMEEISRSGGVPALLGIIRESSCRESKENAVAVLFAVCMRDRTKLRKVLEEESLNRTISTLNHFGTKGASVKAGKLLQVLRNLDKRN